MTKIKWIEIDNFRGISHIRYEPKQINLLIGRNNSGKTTVLEAIYSNLTGRFHEGSRNKERVFRIYDVKLGENHAEIKSDIHNVVLYAIDKELPELIHAEYAVKCFESLLKIFKEKVSDEIIGDLTEFIIEQLHSSISIYDDSMFISIDPDNLRHSDKSISAEYLRLIQKMDPKQVQAKANKIQEFSDILYRMRFLDDIIPYIQKIINENSLPNINNIVHINDINKMLLSSFEDDVKIIELETIIKERNIVPNLERLTEKGVVYKSPDGELTTLPYCMHGDGFFALLQLLYSIKDAAGGVLLIEEPENHMHPGYLSIFVEQLLEWAKELDIQVFMTTHSYDLIETLANYSKQDDTESAEEKEMIQISRIVKYQGEHEIYNYTPDKAFEEMVTFKLDLRGT